MAFVDHGARPGDGGPCAPAEPLRPDHARLGNEGGAVPLVADEIRLALGSDRIAVERVVPDEIADELRNEICDLVTDLGSDDLAKLRKILAALKA